MKSLFKLTTLLLVTPSLLTFITPANAQGANPFDACMKDLTSAGVPVEEAQTGCADALVPKELSACVRNISTNTDIKSIDALKSCYQVRRPMDLGRCVVDINKQALNLNKSNPPKTTATTSETIPSENMTVTTETESTKVSPLMTALQTCQSSLLPLRHSECVIGLSRTPQPFNAVKAMETCLSAEDFPRDLFPAYQ